MARAYSSDLRERVVEAVNEGATRYEVAERFGVSVSSGSLASGLARRGKV